MIRMLKKLKNKKCVIEIMIQFNVYKNRLFKNEIILKSQLKI